MIQVQNLTKRYGATTAIEDVSFEVPKGQVVGFLGPNGAGKSTTMRIITGSLGATAGQVLLDGQDVFKHPRQVKRRIGYLPEVPPLYTDMTVRDYIRFAARLKGVDDVKKATEAVIVKTALEPVAHRIVDHLSKGFRQRCGLAQALVHDPEVLILDEPYSGLDPAQRVEIRELLLAQLEHERTIILSTHVLADIEAMARRVVIINEGRVVAQDDIENLGAKSQTVELELARPDGAVAAFEALDWVISAKVAEDGRLHVETREDRRESVAAAAVPFGLLEMQGRQRLESLFLQLTGEDG